MKNNMKKLIVPALVLSLSLLAVAPAFAASSNYCDSSSTGCDTSSSQTTCAGAGAFGAFGSKDNNFAGGADGTQTGINNSTLCGNPQN